MGGEGIAGERPSKGRWRKLHKKRDSVFFRAPHSTPQKEKKISGERREKEAGFLCPGRWLQDREGKPRRRLFSCLPWKAKSPDPRDQAARSLTLANVEQATGLVNFHVCALGNDCVTTELPPPLFLQTQEMIKVFPLPVSALHAALPSLPPPPVGGWQELPGY